MGWAGAGGSPLDIRILAVSFFFFLWQVPHFWLLLLRYAPEYKEAGFPTLRGRLSEAQLRRITFVWTSAAAAASLMVPIFGHPLHPVFTIALLGLAGWLVLSGTKLLRMGSIGFPPARITLFMLLAMTFLSMGTLLT